MKLVSRLIFLLALLSAMTAKASIRNCKQFELSMELKVLSKIYFLRTMTAEISVSKGKATLVWDSGFTSKKWKIHREDGLMKIKAKKLKEVFESYEDITSNARYVQLINFIEDNEDEDDFRFLPLTEAAPFLGSSNYPNSVGEYQVKYSYSDCNNSIL